MEIRPNRKLYVKQWFTLLTVSVFILLIGLLLQLLIPLNGKVSPDQLAQILWPIVLAVILLLWFISVPIIILWIRNLRYFIEDDRITIHKGILAKIQQNIPYRAITDFMLHRSLYDRFLGIGSLRIQTAGQSQPAANYEGKLSGIENYRELHEQLQGRVKVLHPFVEAAGVADAAKPQSNEMWFQQILSELKAIRRALESG